MVVNHVEAYSCFNMDFVGQNQGRTTWILQYYHPGHSNPRMVFMLLGWVFVKNQPKNPGWTFITFPCG